ncbi:4-phosphoerythronate dehydrogenase [Spongiibacter sp. KMU-166]|uniref:Erythronate-4-phosphate dehydrogenase n=1 Tax=Spongiibacter thalassae TaxID=2721624 RepID=A0ABX1GEC6_9GAMM|nr:4-phosphoerythronate dehydrogenase [Spongiibacter thalassae]
MNILVDENIPMAEAFFSRFGSVVTFAGRGLSPEALVDTDVLIVRSVTRVNAALLAKATKLRFVGSCTIGSDHLDIEYLESRSINWCTAPGSNADSVVDYVVCSLCAVDDYMARLLGGGRLGIIGYGNVGRRLAERVSGLGIGCVAYDPLIDAQSDPRLVGIDEVLHCDVLCLHAPLTRTGPFPSYHLLSLEQLLRLPKGALLLNAGRGEVVATGVLLELAALRPDIQLVLDVWEGEPVVSAELAARCAIATPHIAGYSLDGKFKGAAMVAEALANVLGVSEEQSWPSEVAAALTAPQVSVQDCGEPWQAAALSAYNPKEDHQRFLASLGADDPGGAFDALRKHYPPRRELSRCEFVFDGAVDKAQLNVLSALQGHR